MVSGIKTQKFTKKPNNEELIKNLSKVGFCKEVNGAIELTPFDNNFSYDSKSLISVAEYNGEYTLQIQYTFNPSLAAWLLGICFFPLGFLIFYLPYKAKEDFSDQLFILKWEK